MKQFKYTVFFSGDMSETVNAGCFTDAVILACAERIKKGFHIRALEVQRYNNKGHCEETMPIDRNTITVNYSNEL